MKLKLNLGSGLRKIDGYVNIDIRPEVNPDLVCDVTGGLPFDDNSAEEVRAFDFLEHVPIGKTVGVIEEIYRVLKSGGLFESFTPSVEGLGAFMDPTHCSFWCRASWLYYTDDDWRSLYDIKAKFEIEQIEDVCTNQQFRIIHTYARLYAVKQ